MTTVQPHSSDGLTIIVAHYFDKMVICVPHITPLFEEEYFKNPAPKTFYVKAITKLYAVKVSDKSWQ